MYPLLASAAYLNIKQSDVQSDFKYIDYDINYDDYEDMIIVITIIAFIGYHFYFYQQHHSLLHLGHYIWIITTT